jgi:hypothetical protein
MVVVPGTPDRLFVLTYQQGVFAISIDLEAGDSASAAGEPRNP